MTERLTFGVVWGAVTAPMVFGFVWFVSESLEKAVYAGFAWVPICTVLILFASRLPRGWDESRPIWPSADRLELTGHTYTGRCVKHGDYNPEVGCFQCRIAQGQVKP